MHPVVFYFLWPSRHCVAPPAPPSRPPTSLPDINESLLSSFNFPLGQSWRNPSCHSCIAVSSSLYYNKHLKSFGSNISILLHNREARATYAGTFAFSQKRKIGCEIYFCGKFGAKFRILKNSQFGYICGNLEPTNLNILTEKKILQIYICFIAFVLLKMQ